MTKKKKVKENKDSSQRLREQINDIAFTNNYNSGRKLFRNFNRDAISSLAADLGGNYFHIYNSNGRTPFCCQAPCVRYKCCDINCPVKNNIVSYNTYASFGTSDLNTGDNQDAPNTPSQDNSSSRLSFKLNNKNIVKSKKNNYEYPNGIVNICEKNIHFYVYHYRNIHKIKEMNIRIRINKSNVIKNITISKFAEKYLLEECLNSATENHQLIDEVTYEDGWEIHDVSETLKGNSCISDFKNRTLLFDIEFYTDIKYPWEAILEFIQCFGINELNNNLEEHLKLIDVIKIKNCYEDTTFSPKYILNKYCNGDLTLFYNGGSLNSKYYQYLDYIIITFENKINLEDFECQIEAQDIIFEDPIIFEDSIILKTDPNYRVYIRKNTEELILSGLPNVNVTNNTRIFMATSTNNLEEPISFGVFHPNNYLEIINEVCENSYDNLCKDPCDDPCDTYNTNCSEEVLNTIYNSLYLLLDLLQLVIDTYNHQNNCCLNP